MKCTNWSQTTSALVLLAVTATGGCAADARAPVPDTGTFAVPTVVTNARPMLPVSGGTLLVSRDQQTLIASDPNRDVVWLARPAIGTGAATTVDIDLMAGDEPGRAAEDDNGRVHVLLRRGGAIATIDLVSGTLVRRTPICAAPRGIAWDSPRGVLHVACADGSLLTVLPTTDRVVQVQQRPDDLRDVVVDGDHLLISRFRSAEVLRVGLDGTDTTLDDLVPPMFARRTASDGADGVFEPEVAWRMVRDPQGGAFVVYLRKSAIGTDLTAPSARPTPSRATASTGYGRAAPANDPTSPCTHTDIVHSTVGHVDANGFGPSPTLPSDAALPVDIAVDRGGQQFAVASALTVGSASRGNVVIASATTWMSSDQCGTEVNTLPVNGRPVAVAFFDDGRLAVQTQGPEAIHILRFGIDAVIPLGAPYGEDTGLALFHGSFPDRMGLSGHVACASCHPEGGDDGRVWSFEGQALRTQSLRGDILRDAPFHWAGDLPTFDAVVHQTMPQRMQSAVPDANGVAALANWVATIPRAPALPTADASSADRGAALFRDPTIGCAGCHAGPRLSDHAVVDVGTGGTFKVPSLVGVAMRGPWMHNGCAQTLGERFDPTCGGGDRHGHTSQLSSTQIADLVAYLRSL